MTITPKNIKDDNAEMEKSYEDYKELKRICVQMSYPERGDVLDWYDSIDEGKRKNNRRIYDPTPIQSRKMWADGLLGHYMPKEINWFAEQMADKDLRDSKEVIKWLQETDEHLRFALNQSNYYQEKLVSFNDGGAIGDSFMFIEEDSDNGKLMFQTPHPREFRLRRDFWGRIECIHHKYQKTLRNLVDEFGKQALTDAQLITYENHPEKKVTCIHAIYKNKDFNPQQAGFKNMRWRHYYVNCDADNDGKMIRQGGSETLNPIPWSLNRASHEQYGRGIVASMLLEIITVNFQAKDMALAGQQAVNPAALYPAALRHKISLNPGAKNFYNTKELQGLKMGDLVQRLVDPSGYPFGIDQHDRWQNMVRRGFAIPLWSALQQENTAAKTAFEVNQIKAEQAVLLSPLLGMIGTVTDMEFDRIYSIELNANRAPQPPDEVLQSQNGRIDIQYTGPLAQLLKQYYETGNLLTTIANIQAVLTVSPDSAIVVEGDELMRKILRSGNSPEELILSKEDVQEIRAIAAQQADEQRQMTYASEMAKAVPNLSGKIEKDSVLAGMRAA